MKSSISSSIKSLLTGSNLGGGGGATEQLTAPSTVVAVKSDSDVVLTWVDTESDGRSTSPSVGVAGSSTAAGVGASDPSLAWASGLFQTWLIDNFAGADWANRAASGLETDDVLPAPDGTIGRRVSDLDADGANIIIINLPSNDTDSNVDLATQLANLNSSLSYCQSNSITCFITSTQPRNFGPGDIAKRRELGNQIYTNAGGANPLGSGALSDYNIDGTNDSYRANLGEDVFIDFYTGNVDAGISDPSNGSFTGNILAANSAGDGTHLNDSGHALVFGRARDKFLSWIQSGTDSEQVVIQRSIDGGAWATIATLASPFTKYTDTDPLSGGDGTVDYRVRVTASGFIASDLTASNQLVFGGFDPLSDIDWDVFAGTPDGWRKTGDAQLEPGDDGVDIIRWVDEGGDGTDLTQWGANGFPTWDEAGNYADANGATLGWNLTNGPAGSAIVKESFIRCRWAAVGSGPQWIIGATSSWSIFVDNSPQGRVVFGSIDLFDGSTLQFPLNAWVVVHTVFQPNNEIVELNILDINDGEVSNSTAGDTNGVWGNSQEGAFLIRSNNTSGFLGHVSHFFMKSGTLTTEERDNMWAWFGENAPWD